MDPKFIKVSCNIGSGSFGVVFIGNYGRSKQKLAIKFLKERVYSEDMHREIELLKECNSPYTAEFIQYLPNGLTKFPGCPVIITEYMANGSLDEFMEKFKGDSSKIKDDNINSLKMIWIYGIIKGIQFLHNKSIIHRDIKPENILLDKNCNPHISDFGLAQILESEMTDDDGECGTPHFMAPESIQNSEYGFSSDIYSYGILLYVILTGEVPFADLTQFLLYMTITEGKRAEIPQDIPPLFANLITSCWDQEPSKRPNANDIVSLLEKPNNLPIVNIFSKYIVKIPPIIDMYKDEKDLFKIGYKLEEEKDYFNAFHAYNFDSVFNENPDSMFCVGYFYGKGYYVQQDDDEKMRLYENAGENGSQSALNNLGYYYETGTGVKQDKSKAAQYYKKSADLGNTKARIKIGHYYIQGIGVEKNKKIGLRYYQLAVKKNNKDAQFNLGFCYEKGIGTPANYEKAAELYAQASDQNHAKAQYRLAILYKEGKGVEKDETKSNEFLKLSSQNGNENATKSLQE